MARGREVIARAARQDTLDRWILARKIQVVNFVEGKSEAWCQGVMAAREPRDRNFPSELFVAQVGLAIASLSDFNGVAPADPPSQPKSESAKHVATTQELVWKRWADKVAAEFSAKIDEDILTGMREGTWQK